MKKTSFVVKNLRDINAETHNQPLVIVTSPRQITLRQAKESGKNFRKSKNFHTSIVVAGDDYKETKDNSNLDEFDMPVGKTHYRIFFNKLENKLWVREIVYDKNGDALFVNPVHMETSKQLQKLFKEQNLPKNKRLDTIAHFKQSVEKFYKQEELSLQSKKRLVGNQPSATLLRATLWCIESHPKHLKSKTPTLLRAYKKLGGKTHTEKSFVKMVRGKWNELIREYNRQPVEFRNENSREIYAKSILKIPRNSSKQKTKENEKTFN
jgi:hypothetical protein